jgi:FMN-dependent NADH-azoreductase
VTNLEFISADGIQTGPAQREKALADAMAAVTGLRAA